MTDNNGFVRAETIEGLGPGVWWRWQEWVTPEPVLDDRTCRWIFGEGFYRTHLTFSPRDQRETCHPRHPRGYRREGGVMVGAGDFSPSLTFYRALCDRAKFNFGEKQ